MKTRLFLAFAAILAVTAVAGGCRDAPMAPAPEEAGLGASARRNVSLDPLTVTLNCTHDTFSKTASCQATASGGTGTGYTFYWSYNSYYHSTIGADSWAFTSCPGNENYNAWWGEPWVKVQVGDSGGGWADSGSYYCPEGSQWGWGWG
jgi:hypothetical protein